MLTRLETFLSRKPIRYMVSQKENRLDFAQILDSGKIFLAKLSQGTIGRENSYLLGTLLVSKFQQTAMSRQAQQVAVRKDLGRRPPPQTSPARSKPLDSPFDLAGARTAPDPRQRVRHHLDSRLSAALA